MKILVFGESCKDIFNYGESERLCPEAPVPVFRSLYTNVNGGMAKNVEINLASLGAKVDIITNNNWEIVQKIRFVDYRTNHMFLRVDENDNQINKLHKSVVDNINFLNYDAVIVSDYNKGFLSESILKYVSSKHILTFLDTKKILGSWCENFSFIKINNKEYNNTKSTLNNKIKEKLIRTCGPLGSEYKGELYSVPSVEVKDTSGAGDTFIAALCYQYIKNRNLVEAIKFANECSTKVVQKRGVSII